MKNRLKLIVIIVGSAFLLQTNYAAEVVAPSYWQQIKNNIAESRLGQWWASTGNTDVIGRKRLESVASHAWTGLKRGVVVYGVIGGGYGLYRSDAELKDYAQALMAIGLSWFAYNVIENIVNEYNAGSLPKEAAVEQIKEIINNKLLKKCKSSKEKLELLAQRDYLTEKLQKKLNRADVPLRVSKTLIDEVFNQLIIEAIVEYLKTRLNSYSAAAKYPALLGTWTNIRFEMFWHNFDDKTFTNAINQVLSEYYPVSTNKLNGEPLQLLQESDIVDLRDNLAEGPVAVYRV